MNKKSNEKLTNEQKEKLKEAFFESIGDNTWLSADFDNDEQDSKLDW
jgi:hypothetical protein